MAKDGQTTPSMPATMRRFLSAWSRGTAGSRFLLPLGSIPDLHFVGIGGVGMCPIAEILLKLGCRIRGSHLVESEATARLVSLGARVRYGHEASHVNGADALVVSSAVPLSNPEVVAAHTRGIPVLSRGRMLAELMHCREGIAVAGSHGKTTTTALTASVLCAAGLDPTCVVGGSLPPFGGGARLGGGRLFVAETDESDGSFLALAPSIAIVTNVDREHLDHYRSFEALRRSFLRFIDAVPDHGLAILCADDPHLRAHARRTAAPTLTYGLDPTAEFRAVRLRSCGLRSRFTAVVRGRALGEVELAAAGRHNVVNSLAALAVAHFLGIEFDRARRALAEFSGVDRRLTVVGEEGGITVLDDYGHHPTEIRATVAAIRDGFPGRRLGVVFQPHRHTRTRDLMPAFAAAFDAADMVIVCDIYDAGEQAIDGVTSARLVAEMRAHGHRAAFHVPDCTDAAGELVPRLREGDVVITVGAGDVWQAGQDILAALAGP